MKLAFTIADYTAHAHVQGAVTESRTHILEIPDSMLPLGVRSLLESRRDSIVKKRPQPMADMLISIVED